MGQKKTSSTAVVLMGPNVLNVDTSETGGSLENTNAASLGLPPG